MLLLGEKLNTHKFYFIQYVKKKKIVYIRELEPRIRNYYYILYVFSWVKSTINKQQMFISI